MTNFKTSSINLLSLKNLIVTSVLLLASSQVSAMGDRPSKRRAAQPPVVSPAPRPRPVAAPAPVANPTPVARAEVAETPTPASTPTATTARAIRNSNSCSCSYSFCSSGCFQLLRPSLPWEQQQIIPATALEFRTYQRPVVLNGLLIL